MTTHRDWPYGAPPDDPQAMLELYKTHPLRAETILARIAATRGIADKLTENDLAIDPETAVTDQNHIGGFDAVRELAAVAGVDKETRIVDLGCGLGGPARVLAALFGCTVHGIDISPQRCTEAVDLN